MPTPSGRNGSADCLGNGQETEFDVLRREFQAEVEKLSARLACVEQSLKSNMELAVAAADSNDREQLGNHEMELQKVEPEFATVECRTDCSDSLHPESDVHFEESAWTYPLVIGLVDAKAIDVAFAILLLLLNLCMQLLFSYIITRPEFMGEEFSDKVTVAKQWRTSFAHDHKYVDLSSTSLVSRVCSADGALILATTQATMVMHINNYLGLKPDQFEAGFLQPGILLCVLCIVLWGLCIYKEFRRTGLALEAVWKLPRSEKTLTRDNAIQSLSKSRFLALICTYFTRFVIAGVLLFSGVQWLARTTSITDLMLNAVALNAILDVDEFLFAGFTPISLQVAIKDLEPIKVRYTSRRSQLESVCMFLLLLGTFLLPYVSLLQPLGVAMMDVKREMCGGNQTFVVGENAQTQVVLGYKTATGRSSDEPVMELAVRTHHSQPPGVDPLYITFVDSMEFDRERTVSMADESNDFTLCMESAVLQPTGIFYQDPVLTSILSPRLRTAAAYLGILDVKECEEMRDFCNRSDARQLRLMCGDTCGCTDPRASNWFMVAAYGCSESCSRVALETFRGQCQDAPNDDKWKQLWDGYLPALESVVAGISQSQQLYETMQQVIAAMKEGGCQTLAHPDFRMEVGSSRTWCEGNPSLYRPFSWQCPVTCGCLAANPPSYCPPC